VLLSSPLEEAQAEMTPEAEVEVLGDLEALGLPLAELD
jgi:hypothetical protein